MSPENQWLVQMYFLLNCSLFRGHLSLQRCISCFWVWPSLLNEFIFVISVCILSATQIMELEAAVKKYDKTGHVEEDEEDQMLLWKYVKITIVSICCSLRSGFLAFLVSCNIWFSRAYWALLIKDEQEETCSRVARRQSRMAVTQSDWTPKWMMIGISNMPKAAVPWFEWWPNQDWCICWLMFRVVISIFVLQCHHFFTVFHPYLASYSNLSIIFCSTRMEKNTWLAVLRHRNLWGYGEIDTKDVGKATECVLGERNGYWRAFCLHPKND